MRVLVIGGSGAIGAPTVEALVRAGHDVRSTARSESAKTRLISLGAEATSCDIYDIEALQQAMKGCDTVIRLTTKIPKSVMGMRSKAVWEETNRLRTVGAAAIVEAAKREGVGTYITESFYAAYKSNGDNWIDETSPSDDGGVDTMKAVLTTEELANSFSRTGRGIALRFGGIYGSNIGTTTEVIELLRKRMLPAIGAGDYFFPSVHVDDVASAVVAALDAPSGVYNVGDDNPRRWSEYLQDVAALAGAPPPMRLPGFLGPVAMGYPWKWMTRSIRLSNAKLKNVTGWAPRYADAVSAMSSILREPAAVPSS